MTSLSNPTNAASSGVKLDKGILKALSKKSNVKGLLHVSKWLCLLAGSTLALFYSMGTMWFYPALLLQSVTLTIPIASLSHETCHSTVFKKYWLNEVLYWIVSILYMEPPAIHRYAHMEHHTHTWINGLDAQMTHNPPLTLGKWFAEFTSYNQVSWDLKFIILSTFGRIDPVILGYVPKHEHWKLAWESRLFLVIYAAIAYAIYATGVSWPIYYIILPRLIGGFIWQLYVIVMHSEMKPDTLDIRESTRSFTTNRFSRFIYSNMNYHIEHHMYPMVPFHALPELSKALEDQLPEPNKGLFRTNAYVFRCVLARLFKRSTSEYNG